MLEQYIPCNLHQKLIELSGVSGKTLEELIELFKNGQVIIKKPLFEIGDKIQFKDIEFSQMFNGIHKADIKLYNAVGVVKDILPNNKYEVGFGYGYTTSYHEDYLRGLKKVN